MPFPLILSVIDFFLCLEIMKIDWEQERNLHLNRYYVACMLSDGCNFCVIRIQHNF